MAPPGGALCLPPRRLAAGQGDVAQVEDWKWVGLRVEDPTLKWHQVVAGEQQVEIPVVGTGVGCGGGGKEAGVSRSDTEFSIQRWRGNISGVGHQYPECCGSDTDGVTR